MGNVVYRPSHPAAFLQGNLGSWGTYGSSQVFNDFQTSGNYAFVSGGMGYSNGRLTVNTSGVYLAMFNAYVRYGSGQVGNAVRWSIMVNGGEAAMFHAHAAGNQNVPDHTHNVSCVLSLNNNDYVEFKTTGYQSSTYRNNRHTYGCLVQLR